VAVVEHVPSGSKKPNTRFEPGWCLFLVAIPILHACISLKETIHVLCHQLVCLVVVAGDLVAAVRGVHAFTVWAMSSAGALETGAAGAASVQAVLLPAWLQGWIPPELLQTLESWVTSAGPMLQGVLESVPALAGAVTVLAWGIWGLGAIFLLALAVGVHVLISLIKRNGRSLEQVAQTARSRMAQGG
jgi:hypothetical protein